MAQITMTNSTSQVSRTLARRGPSGKSQAARNNVGAGRYGHPEATYSHLWMRWGVRRHS